MLKRKAASAGKLERTVARYRAKLAGAANPTQRGYAASMLRMAEKALAESQADAPAVETPDRDVVTLHRSEYSVREG